MRRAGARRGARAAGRKSGGPGAARAAAPEGKSAARATPLTRIVGVRAPAYASVSIEHDLHRGGGGAEGALDGYIPGAGTLDTVARLGAGMRGGRRGHAISVTGPYGSGKSAMAVFLDALLAPKKSREYEAAAAILRCADARLAGVFDRSRSQLGVQRNGMIRCMATAKREPVSATILRALDSGARRRFGTGYGEKDFEGASSLARMARGLGRAAAAPDAAAIAEAARGMCAADPAIIVIDEFGKNVEYFTDENTREGDLFLLQELAEMSGASRGVRLFLVTMQHMAFEEYASGASSSQRREWAKVQGRFDDIPFANSPEQARRLVRSVLVSAVSAGGAGDGGDAGAAAKRAGLAVRRWSKAQAGRAAAMGLGGDLDEEMLRACYPLHPLALEVLPELCSRYGQHERTLISFMTGGGEHTVAGFVDRAEWDGSGPPPAVMVDTLYDYFVAGSPLVRAASSSRASRLLEIETIIRDTQGLSADESRVLKAVGVLNLVGRAGRLRASRSMVAYAAGVASPDAALGSLEKRSILTYRRHSDEYRIWHGTDVDVQARLENARRRLAAMPATELLRATLPLDPVVAARHALQTGTTRIFERVFAGGAGAAAASVQPGPGFDGAIVYLVDEALGEEGREGEAPREAEAAAGPDKGRTADGGRRPTALVEAADLEALREAALEVASVRDVRDNSPEVQADWVARREVAERLAWAESALEKAFEAAYGGGSMILSVTISAAAPSGARAAPRRRGRGRGGAARASPRRGLPRPARAGRAAPPSGARPLTSGRPLTGARPALQAGPLRRRRTARLPAGP